jgi:hypothetical protein
MFQKGEWAAMIIVNTCEYKQVLEIWGRGDWKGWTYLCVGSGVFSDALVALPLIDQII